MLVILSFDLRYFLITVCTASSFQNELFEYNDSVDVGYSKASQTFLHRVKVPKTVSNLAALVGYVLSKVAVFLIPYHLRLSLSPLPQLMFFSFFQSIALVILFFSKIFITLSTGLLVPSCLEHILQNYPLWVQNGMHPSGKNDIYFFVQ